MWRGFARGEPRGRATREVYGKSGGGRTLRTLTVREVKVMHMPPKPLKVRAIKIRTERSANNTDVISRGFPQSDTLGQKSSDMVPSPFGW